MCSHYYDDYAIISLFFYNIYKFGSWNLDVLIIKLKCDSLSTFKNNFSLTTYDQVYCNLLVYVFVFDLCLYLYNM